MRLRAPAGKQTSKALGRSGLHRLSCRMAEAQSAARLGRLQRDRLPKSTRHRGVLVQQLRPAHQRNQADRSNSGKQLSFNSPVTISYRVSHQAQLHHWQTPHTRNAGVENMTIRVGDDGNVRFEWAAYCWAQDVESTLWLGEGFAIDSAFRVQLEEFYVIHPFGRCRAGAATTSVSRAAHPRF